MNHQRKKLYDLKNYEITVDEIDVFPIGPTWREVLDSTPR
jgi:hypothetical protein